MFEKIFESKEKQHARHLAWAKAHPQEMKALIRKCLPLSSHGTGLKYVAAYYAACCVWEHRWFWEDNLRVIITTHADQLLECGYHDFVFAIPSFTDTVMYPDLEPWPESTVNAIYYRYITASQETVKHYHMDQWDALLEAQWEKDRKNMRRNYDEIVFKFRRYVRKSPKFKW